MIEIIIEGILHLFVEIIFQGIILGFLKMIKLLGILILKLITLSSLPISELRKKYKDSALPYFLGFGLIIGTSILIIKF